jgi:hypothetical protein
MIIRNKKQNKKKMLEESGRGGRREVAKVDGVAYLLTLFFFSGPRQKVEGGEPRSPGLLYIPGHHRTSQERKTLTPFKTLKKLKKKKKRGDTHTRAIS